MSTLSCSLRSDPFSTKPVLRAIQCIHIHIPLVCVTKTDDVCFILGCHFLQLVILTCEPDIDDGATLALRESLECTGFCIITQADVDSGKVTERESSIDTVRNTPLL